MIQADLIVALAGVITTCEELAVDYSIVGSVASSAYGIARSTIDADVVANLPLTKVDAFVARLESAYYVDLDAARDAVRRRSMFNAIHLETMIKVDVYILTDREFDRSSFGRRVSRALLDEPEARAFVLDTAEDTILHKLEWYRAGGEVSDRQWSDITGVIAVQAQSLDLAYLRKWAIELGVTDLLERALANVH